MNESVKCVFIKTDIFEIRKTRVDMDLKLIQMLIISKTNFMKISVMTSNGKALEQNFGYLCLVQNSFFDKAKNYSTWYCS